MALWATTLFFTPVWLGVQARASSSPRSPPMTVLVIASRGSGTG